jgi:hypothetical protein
MTAVLALTALTGCSDDDKATSPAPSAAASGPAGVPSDEPTVQKGDHSEPGPAAGAISPFKIGATGYGPYQVEETQADMVDSELVTDLADAAGCTAGTGSILYGSPEVFFAQGKLVLVRATSPGVKTDAGVGVGATLADAQAKLSGGKLLTGAAGAQGWQVVEETNAVLFEVTGDKVTAVLSGASASVEKHFTAGSGC